MITADFAAEQGKYVMAVPGRPTDELSEGCNELIAQGAGVVLSVESLIETIFSDISCLKKKLSDDLILAPAEKLVYSSLGLCAKSLWELEFEALLYLPQRAWALKYRRDEEEYPHIAPLSFETGSNRAGWA